MDRNAPTTSATLIRPSRPAPARTSRARPAEHGDEAAHADADPGQAQRGGVERHRQQPAGARRRVVRGREAESVSRSSGVRRARVVLSQPNGNHCGRWNPRSVVMLPPCESLMVFTLCNADDSPGVTRSADDRGHDAV